ncbi:MAG: ATP-binding protein, partial [Syntrophomonas sp.]|nr:ATP-binding protein [Syntrophomonas sp.]
ELSWWAIPEERDLIIKNIKEHGKLRNFESNFKIKSGEIRTLLISAEIIDMGDKPHLLLVSKDITEQRMAEKRNQELMLELQSVNLELKDFAYIVSHDLKAPLRGIRSLADWLYNDYKDKFDEEGKEQLDMLINRVDRMNKLIEGILRYSRLTSKNEDKTVININQAVQEVIEMLEPPDNISIIIKNELPSLTLERTRTQQLFTNLINNAIKFMDKPNGEISISCQNQGEFWQFRIQDNGCGIEEKNFDNIFTIFKTLKPRDEFESTGIGLTIVKKIVEIYGGKVWVESKLGEGSTFYFTLPDNYGSPGTTTQSV